MGALALALMIAILPSSLHLPTTGPGSQAEVAPVPGQGKTQANLSQLGLADSGTVGAGGSSALADAASTPPPLAELLAGLAPGGGVAQQAHCVGNPPRQTEDPLSPPCVAFWKGDNGGSTATGVTRNAISVAASYIYVQKSDYTTAVTSTDSPYTRTFKVLLRYFQSRFQTYGRQVQVVSSNQGPLETYQAHHPFAGLEIGQGIDRDWAKLGVENFTSFPSQTAGPTFLPRNTDLSQQAPFSWSALPSDDALVAAASDWVCHSIQGRPATRAVDPKLRLGTRRIAILYGGLNSQTQTQPYADHLNAATRQLCGYAFAQEIYAGNVNGGTTDGSITAAVAKARTDNDTTLFCYPCPNFLPTFQEEADRQGYLPEYLFADGYPNDNSNARNLVQAQWSGAAGITWRWRQPPISQTFWWTAYQQVDPTGTPDRSTGPAIYHYLMQLFSMVQLAGPRLTPAAAEQGMVRWHRPSPDVFSPEASYEPGDHSFIKDWMEEVWDPSGVPPGGAQSDLDLGGNQGGCYRLVDGGARYNLARSHFPDDDRASSSTNLPCQADTTNNTDAGQDEAQMNQGTS
ncbi:MAG: type 1 periplasmic-binding domain-containing protein [Candidatus Dormibacteria bacterium]